MEAIWNDKQLERPPNAICHVECQKFGKFNSMYK